MVFIAEFSILSAGSLSNREVKASATTFSRSHGVNLHLMPPELEKSGSWRFTVTEQRSGARDEFFQEAIGGSLPPCAKMPLTMTSWQRVHRVVAKASGNGTIRELLNTDEVCQHVEAYLRIRLVLIEADPTS